MLILLKSEADYKEAVKALAGTGNLSDRLRKALLCIGFLPPDCFASFPELERQHLAIMKLGTAKEAEFDGEGAIDATTRDVHWKQFAAISSMIVDAAFEIADARASRAPSRDVSTDKNFQRGSCACGDFPTAGFPDTPKKS